MIKYMTIFILTLILIFSGCVKNEGKTVYFSQKSNETVTYYDDYTFTVISPKTSVSGVYRIDGDYIIATFPPFGTVGVVKKVGNSIVDEKTGETWVRL